MTAPDTTRAEVEALARAWWIEDTVADGAPRSWAEDAWDDMGGSEPAAERADCEIIAAAILSSDWLAQHDARIKAEAATQALQEAAQELDAAKTIPVDVRATVRAVLWGRAARVEAGEQP